MSVMGPALPPPADTTVNASTLDVASIAFGVMGAFVALGTVAISRRSRG
jgi:hypothetical protein